ncbi:MAG TPA: M61 family peptidase [Terriglobales bacterium]
MRKSALVVLFFLSSLLQAQQTSSIQLAVDATDAPRKIIHAKMTIPAAAGPLTLVYPKWIPGEHGPTGPVVDTAGIVISANGQPLQWTRDDVEMYALHVNVPAGASSVDVAMDFLATAAAEGFSAGASSSEKLVIVSWNEVLMYPAGKAAADVSVSPSLKLPANWKFGTALETTSQNAGEVTFKPVSLEMLVDSPVLAGEYFREIPISTPPERPHFIDLAADSAAALQMTDETIGYYKRLVNETGALFGARHYNSYHFLVTLSDYVAHFGLEHHQSSDDRIPERTYIDENERKVHADLLPHEFTHSWNGKYRRPAGLATPSYQEPMKGELLWVYEGLTQYWGEILAARSGLLTPELFREQAAVEAAYLDQRQGRRWRDLQDTATAAQLLYGASRAYEDWRRSTDYYDEGFLVWLEADTIIRQQSHGAKSLNDFSRLFHGGQSGPPMVRPYTFDDIVNALNQIVPYDWRTFWLQRLQSKAPHAPLGGIENGGYRLVYNSTPSQWMELTDGSNKSIDERFSIGLFLKDNGAVVDVILNSPAAKAGFAPGMLVVAVNGRKFSGDIFKQAIMESKNSPLDFIVENAEYYNVLHVDYHEGPKFPHLERVPGKPALFDDIIKPLAH